MKLHKAFGWLILIFVLICSVYIAYRQLFAKKEKQWFTTETAQRRTISQVIRATGYLEADNLITIGSLVAGVLTKFFVDENDHVKAGDTVAVVNDGRGDTDVREAQGYLTQAENDLKYMTSYYNRQKALFEAGQLAIDAFERMTRDMENAKATVETRQSVYDRAVLMYNYKTIKAPVDGVIIEKVAKEGDVVALTTPVPVIFTMVHDLTRIKVQIEVDENRIGDVKINQTADLTFDTYPYKKFSGTITNISYAPVKKQTAVSYRASFIIDNKELLLGPGMTVNARINVEEKENVLAVPGNIFAINSILLEGIAKMTGYGFKPMPLKEKRELEKKGAYKTLWVVKDKNFVEKAVELGINDNAFFEVLSGLKEDERFISDVQEPDSMQQFYSKVFGKGL